MADPVGVDPDPTLQKKNGSDRSESGSEPRKTLDSDPHSGYRLCRYFSVAESRFINRTRLLEAQRLSDVLAGLFTNITRTVATTEIIMVN